MSVSAFRKAGPRQSGGIVPLPDLRLNLGCGARPLDGYLNIDSNPLASADLVRDLCRGLPFSDNTVAEVVGQDVLEHLDRSDLIFVVNECHRVLRRTGQAIFEVPNATSQDRPEWAFGDPTHRTLICAHTWDYFTLGHEQFVHTGRFYGILPWTVQIEQLHGDGIIRATMRPAKG